MTTTSLNIQQVHTATYNKNRLLLPFFIIMGNTLLWELPLKLGDHSHPSYTCEFIFFFSLFRVRVPVKLD